MYQFSSLIGQVHNGKGRLTSPTHTVSNQQQLLQPSFTAPPPPIAPPPPPATRMAQPVKVFVVLTNVVCIIPWIRGWSNCLKCILNLFQFKSLICVCVLVCGGGVQRYVVEICTEVLLPGTHRFLQKKKSVCITQQNSICLI